MSPIFFLLYPGIPGGSEISGREGWIDIETFELSQFRVVQNGSVDSPGPDQPAELKVHKYVDVATPELFLASLNSTPATTDAQLVVSRSSSDDKVGPYDAIRVILKRPMITGYSATPNTGLELVREEITIAYDEICVERTAEDDSGSLGTPQLRCWNASTNTGG